jgi:hypothetical protein
MQFLEWLDRHFASNCHYYYADDLGCPFDMFPQQLSGEDQPAPAATDTPAAHPGTEPASWRQ